jgi:aminopeptidase-like protein
MDLDNGKEMINLVKKLWPIPRSITGNGVRETLSILKEHLPELNVFEVPSGTKVFDWTVPKEWNIKDAYVLDPEGNKIIDFKQNNLHLLGYSIPVNRQVSLKELKEHLYSLPEQPNAIPYITSYYKERWGFCISHDQLEKLKEGSYKVYIDSSLSDGSLTYGELILPGNTPKEIFLSTYVCHPSMANNELSGPIVTAFLSKWLMGLKSRKYTYRIVFIPETIGSITYLSENLEKMKKDIVAGYNITCIGDDRSYSYLPSRHGTSLSDKIAKHVLKHLHPDYISYSYLDRGSDERQYCSPGVDLPVCTVMRTKYGEYPEYHTSLDNLDLVTASGLFGGYEVLLQCIQSLENNEIPTTSILGEPQLGKRGLYPTLSTKETGDQVRVMMDLLAYCDGKHSLLEIAEIINAPIWELKDIVDKLKEKGVLDGENGAIERKRESAKAEEPKQEPTVS